MAPIEVNRGDIWLVDLGLVGKIRPAVVLSVRFLDHERALVTYVPRTTSIRGTRFETAHSAPSFTPGVFDAQGISTIPVSKLVKRIGTVPTSTLRQVETSVRLWLNL